MIAEVVEELRRQLEVEAGVRLPARPEAVCAVAIARRWRGPACWAVFAGRDATPAAIVKIAQHAQHAQHAPRVRSEHDALRELAQREEVADSVPRPLALLELRQRLVSAQAAVPGSQMNVVVSRRRPGTARAAARDHDLILRWLARLHSLAAGERQAVDSRGVVERVGHLLADAPRRRPMLSHVEALSRVWAEASVPHVPTHGDLTPANCFLHRGRLRVIDWEGGLRLRTPLAGIVTFLVDYARWVPSSGNQPLDPRDALRAAFLTDTWLARLTARTYHRYLRELGLPAEAAEYLFIATLADLAAGVAQTANPARAAAYSAELLHVYAREYEASILRA